MLNERQIQNNWSSIKPQVLSKWSKLSESDVDKTLGRASLLGKLVHSKYGNREEFDKAYEKICESCFSTAASKTRPTKS